VVARRFESKFNFGFFYHAFGWKIAKLRWGHGAAFALRQLCLQLGADLRGDIEIGKLARGEDAVAKVLRRMQEVS